MGDQEAKKIREVLQEALKKAGEKILEHRGTQVLKEKPQDEIVTQADVEAEKIILGLIGQNFPDHQIYSEEAGEKKGRAAYRWIVDPLDGTTPWVWGNSGFGVSIGVEYDGKMLMGGVYDPIMKELFFAQRGKGATRNGVKISPSKLTDIAKALIVYDWGNKKHFAREGVEHLVKLYTPKIASRIVPQFAPALGLCKIAEGRIHALLCNDTWVEDHAAGSLVLQEAAGVVTNFYQRDTFDHRQTGIIATCNKEIYQKIVERIFS